MKKLIFILGLLSFGANADSVCPEFQALTKATASVINLMCMTNIDSEQTRSECVLTHGQLIAQLMDEELKNIRAEEARKK
ncbi:hypothetical protein Q9V03_000763 [Salmonella enterica]|nr:hypothetical protein [Salmonella enterica]ECO7735883.1 hypothetical protein [Salmonella enterica]EDZ7377419.1 hypothetical protein [Salmonella enterica]EEL9952949.1 hypothetical protein [Salmonella enterica]EEM1605887.1 hypothetical protein [Salmonella enterica]